MTICFAAQSQGRRLFKAPIPIREQTWVRFNLGIKKKQPSREMADMLCRGLEGGELGVWQLAFQKECTKGQNAGSQSKTADLGNKSLIFNSKIL